MNHEFYRRLRILLWAIAHHDIRHCRFNGPVELKIERHPWKNSGPIYPALQISLCFQQPSIYLPYEVQEAYGRRNWTAEQWDEFRQSFDDIPF